MSIFISRHAVRVVFGLTILARPSTASAQTGAPDSLVTRALVANPQLRSFEAQAAAARVRVTSAGTWADPMLMAGIQNLPLAGDVAMPGPEPMTMKMLGVSQTIPYPGKTTLRARIARSEADAADARLTAARRELRRDVLNAYYDVVAARTLLRILERQQEVASGIIPATEARYVSGSAPQADVLKARNEAAALVEERNVLQQEERTALARLNAALDQPSFTSLAADSLAVPPNALPALDSLQALALAENPRMVERRAMIAGQAARADLARRERLPDFDVTVQYGQRDGLPDMITALVSVPVPIQRRRKQDVEVRATQLDLASAEADLRAEANAIRSEVARLHATMERHAANLALFDRVILPQARATFASASSVFQSGRGELLGVLDAMRALFATETMRVRTLAEYLKSVAELEAAVGREVVP